MTCLHSASRGMQQSPTLLFRRIPRGLAAGTLAWGFQRGEAQLSPLVKGGVHTPPAKYIDFCTLALPPKGA